MNKINNHICYYCGEIAKYKFKNGQYCCENHPKKCPAKRKDQSNKVSGKNHPSYGKFGKANPKYGKSKYTKVKVKGAPYCSCPKNCGEKTKWNGIGYNKYVNGHQNKGEDHWAYGIKRPDVSKRMKENNPCFGKTGKDHPCSGLDRSNEKNSNWKGGKIVVSCSQCGNTKEIFPSYQKYYNSDNYFCDGKCYGKWQVKVVRERMLNGQAAYMCSLNQNPSKPQIELFELVKQFYPNAIFNYPSLNFCIDIAIPDQNIAIEYDCWYWHDEKKDKIRQSKLENIGWKFLRYKDYIPNIDKLESDLKPVDAARKHCAGRNGTFEAAKKEIK